MSWGEDEERHYPSLARETPPTFTSAAKKVMKEITAITLKRETGLIWGGMRGPFISSDTGLNHY